MILALSKSGSVDPSSKHSICLVSYTLIDNSGANGLLLLRLIMTLLRVNVNRSFGAEHLQLLASSHLAT
jgi:hypothetical protein